MKKRHVIDRVSPGSIASELEVEPGDILISVNGKEIEDVFDYHYLVNDEYLEILIEKRDGQEWELQVEKDYDEDLGIVFENGLMDEYRSCSNRCIFCFIDQMPPGMRDTLYFKDDDSRLSFLQGNYITLTNLKEKDMERIIRYKLAPINISVHTTNPALRCEMLRNRFAGEALKKLDLLYEGKIQMNGQIVLCRGVNDGEELERTIRDLTKYIPYMESLSVVPVGLTKYRQNLYPLELFDREDARAVISTIEKWQEYCMREYGIHFVHASDEWYLLAGEKLPGEESYDGYLQLENGVGMLRLLMEEFSDALAEMTEDVARTRELVSRYGQCSRGKDGRYHVTLATGMLAHSFIREMAAECERAFPEYELSVVPIRNDFFGESITVSGLITGRDLVGQLIGRGLEGVVAIPCNMLRAGENVFLDDTTLQEAQNTLQVPIVIVKSSGRDLLCAMLGLPQS